MTTLPANLIENLALRELLIWLRDKNIFYVQIEVNAKTVADAILFRREDSSKFDKVIDDCKFLLI